MNFVHRGITLWVSAGLAVLLATSVQAQPSGENGNIPVKPKKLEKLLRREPFEIREVKGAGGGVTGAKKLTIFYPDQDLELKVKWKPVPSGGDGWNNSPRRELVAYEIQKWFLEPEDYVVPTTVARCVAMDAYKAIEDKPKSGVGEFDCVLGISSIWLSNVTVPDTLYDEDRFDRDENYAKRLADMNLLGFLIKHQDGRKGNFLTSVDEKDRRVFAVDNGISFGVFVHNFLVKNWHKIRVPKLREDCIDELRDVDDDDFADLAVVAELRVDEANRLQHAKPGKPNTARNGVSITASTVQLGLSAKEIERVRGRVEWLLKKVDSGEIGTF